MLPHQRALAHSSAECWHSMESPFASGAAPVVEGSALWSGQQLDAWDPFSAGWGQPAEGTQPGGSDSALHSTPTVLAPQMRPDSLTDSDDASLVHQLESMWTALQQRSRSSSRSSNSGSSSPCVMSTVIAQAVPEQPVSQGPAQVPLQPPPATSSATEQYRHLSFDPDSRFACAVAAAQHSVMRRAASLPALRFSTHWQHPVSQHSWRLWLVPLPALPSTGAACSVGCPETVSSTWAAAAAEDRAAMHCELSSDCQVRESCSIARAPCAPVTACLMRDIFISFP